jgi:hypothetical protein
VDLLLLGRTAAPLEHPIDLSKTNVLASSVSAIHLTAFKKTSELIGAYWCLLVLIRIYLHFLGLIGFIRASCLVVYWRLLIFICMHLSLFVPFGVYCRKKIASEWV